ncbi:AMP-binding protein [Haloarcula rara]|uniref:AMP-binding protein n=1 Tax=Haloarcula rara TaxID=3033387 RepID=UPI0023E7FBB1|nr:AMP-binding protein [Halomicroarcula sp. SHR3]
MREPVEWPTRDLVAHRAGTTPERTAIVDADRGEERTYRELDAAVDSVAAAFDAACASDGGRVAALVDTRPAVAELLYGAMRTGRTFVPLNVELAPETLGPSSTRSRPTCWSVSARRNRWRPKSQIPRRLGRRGRRSGCQRAG